MDNIIIEEFKRKSFHLLSLIYVLAYWVLPKTAVLWGLGIFIVIVASAEIIRLKNQVFNKCLLGVLGGVHRESEINKVSGLPWTISGSFLTILLFNNKNIVMASFLYLAFGDAFAAIVGRKFGKHKILFGKSLEGSLSCFFVCFLTGLIFLNWQYAAAGALIATIVELIPWPLNDNFWMPLISSAMLTFILK